MVRIAIAPWVRPSGWAGFDVHTLHAWMVQLATRPLGNFYVRTNLEGGHAPDHLPGDLWFLWIVAHLLHLWRASMPENSHVFLLLVKLVPATADVAIGRLLFLIVRRIAVPPRGWLITALFVFNPASIYLTAFWGQWDSVSAAFAVAAVWLFLRGNPEWSFPVLIYACLIKPQLAALVPLFVLAFAARVGFPAVRWTAREEGRWPLDRISTQRIVVALSSSLAVLYGVLLPFNVGVAPFSLRWSLLGRLRFAWDLHPFIDNSAFNLWATPLTVETPSVSIAPRTIKRWSFI